MHSNSIHPEAPETFDGLTFWDINTIFQQGETISTNEAQTVKSCRASNLNLIIKEYIAHGSLAKMRLKLGLSRPHKAFRYAKLLEGQNILCPRHYLVASNITNDKYTTLLVMERAPGKPLYEFIHADQKIQLSDEAANNTAMLIKEIHALGISHGDMHARNFIVAPDDTVRIIDLDNVRLSRLSKNRQSKDLVRFTQAIKKGKHHTSKILNALNQPIGD
ncbi:MAG: lipopolysaccharide core heptose(II) kinase RfaY [Akkermansiaceae bacterium]